MFAVSAAVYIATMERTASFWDCGEFIAVSYKLMVPHPPGAPLFLLIGRIFSFFAGGDVTQVAYWVNMVSALSSAATVMFLYWAIVLLARKMVKPGSADDTLTTGDTVSIIGAGVIGALAYTFSDSFWFSAVEAEVYAMSALFTALVVWAMLKWEVVADRPGADRWLILIAYFTGLSIGVHLLNLVTVPALGFIYFFKRSEQTTGKAIIAFLISMALVGLILVGIIPGLPSLAGKFEVFFVNNLGLPFNSGVIFFCIAFVAALTFGIIYSVKNQKVLLNTALVSLVYILIGYASYGIIVIRANYSTPINENDPSNVLSFVSYLKREQYGDRPLLYGPQFNAQPIDEISTAPVYERREKKADGTGENKYEIIEYKKEPVYQSKDKTLLPRIYSPQGNHVRAYKNWVNVSPDRKPTFGQNLAFMFKYQFNFMYFRYFLWNFAGRESDVQDAEWLSPFDALREVPDVVGKNAGRNNFLMLPLILGLGGLAYQIIRNGRNALVVGLLFFFTGLAIVIYLNQPPTEPRERDYTFAGSFYAFSIWIGLGVLMLRDLLDKIFKNVTTSAFAATLLSLSVPAIMGFKGWDDHDRSGRYHTVDSAHNLLNSCAKNAILFTGGDNDTFPLWYAQEVEGIRTDVRVCNLSLLGTHWYIAQMKLQAYDSPPLPISMEYENFVQGKNDYLPSSEKASVKNGMDLKTYIKLVKENNPAIVIGNATRSLNSLPTQTFILNVDSAAVAAQVPEKERGQIVKQIRWNIGKSTLYKPDLIMLDILATNDWKRPIYFSTTLVNSSYLNLKEYFELEGLAYRFLPVMHQGAQQGVVNTEVMYKNMMKVFKFRGLNEAGHYYDENYKRFPLNARNCFYRLAADLYNEGDSVRSKEVVDYCLKVMPDKGIAYDPYSPQFIPLMIRLGEKKEALEMANVIGKRTEDELEYYSKHEPRRHTDIITNNLFQLQQLSFAFREDKDQTTFKKYDDLLHKYERFAQDAGGYEEE